MPLASAQPGIQSQIPKTNEYVAGTECSDFSHTVIAEYATTTQCGYCPIASSQLYSIYTSHDYEFYFVTLVADKNAEVYGRVQELEVTGVPDVYFDGGYKNILGKQNDETPYRNAIEQSGEREVPDIDISVEVDFKGGGILKIKVAVNNNEPEEYDGLIRVYIVEPESRWNDAQGNPYHFGVLDVPIDRSLSLMNAHACPIGETYTFSRTWIGGLHGFADITEDNIMVVAAVFDGESDNAVETAAGVPSGGSGSHSFFILQAFRKMLEILWQQESFLFLKMLSSF
jgi:hypothetical protein